MLNNLFHSPFTTTTNYAISFEDMQYVIKNGDIIINTLPTNEQECLIKNTTPYQNEESIINEFITRFEYQKRIIVYGKNCNDETVEKKQKQLRALGFSEVYYYRGGIFEWLLLNDIYGTEEFPIINKSQSRVIDIYKYRPLRKF